MNLFLGQFLDFLLDSINLLTLLTDNDSWAARVNGDDNPLQRSLQDKLGHTAVVDTGVEVTADFVVLQNFVGVVFAAKPVGIPAFDVSQP